MATANETEARKQELAAWYLAHIGYDPFADCPAITIQEVEQVRADWLALAGEA